MKKKIKEFFDYLSNEYSLDDKDLYIFGANASGTIIFNELLKRGYQVNVFLDNNPLLENSYCMEKPVAKPDKMLFPINPNAMIFIASNYYEAMKLQLEQLGYKENINIFKVVHIDREVKASLAETEKKQALDKLYTGMEIYERLRKKYGVDIVIVSPVTPNGDTYIICSYINQFMGKDFNGQSYVLTVRTKSCELVANLFNIENLEIISKEETEALLTLSNFYPQLIRGMSPTHTSLGFCYHFDGYNGLNFVDQIKIGLMGLDKNVSPQYPNMKVTDERLSEICSHYGVVRNKSVIISPYAKSVPEIREDIWETLVEKLNYAGFKVYTNCGVADEVPIKGSEKIFFEFNEAVAICEYAGTVISYRSGFSDIIGSSKCKKIIVYPDNLRAHAPVRVLYGMEDSIYEQHQLYQLTNCSSDSSLLINDILNLIN